jgi:hypothetical protein
MTPEQKMWQSVVVKAALDATSNPSPSSDDYMAQKNADAWLRTGGRDFKEVCSLAGLDPDFIQQAYIGGRINADLLRSKELSQ